MKIKIPKQIPKLKSQEKREQLFELSLIILRLIPIS
jgi:hypothetical protein